MVRKQLYGYITGQTVEISHEKTRTWLRKENLKKENESQLIAAKKNKKFKFDHTNKWYMHNSKSLLENETYKVFEI